MTSGSRAATSAKEEPLSLRERNKRERADRILAAALELLREDPEANLTVERIAKRANVAAMTVFNLVGNREQIWSALADRALVDLDLQAIWADDPQERARRIVDAVVDVLQSDAAVFRVLLARWSGSGRVLEHDPTEELVECLRAAADVGMVRDDVNLRRYGEVIATGLVGTIHQWTAGLLSNRAFRSRAREMVDIVFAAAKPEV